MAILSVLVVPILIILLIETSVLNIDQTIVTFVHLMIVILVHLILLQIEIIQLILKVIRVEKANHQVDIEVVLREKVDIVLIIGKM